MIYSDNATYTYRGFRLQALYTVHQILTSPDSYIFQPEGIEDLAIFKNKELTDVIQIKSGNSLSLSDLKNSFFERLISLQSTNPNINIQLVKFGHIGIELKKACKENGKERQKVINKLLNREKFNCNKNQLETLLSSIQSIEVSEETIYQELDNTLKSSLLGINKNHAFDLLINWIYNTSENQELITSKILKEKIINIGKFLKGRETYHNKWFSIIQPIEFLSIDEKQKESLALSYYQGESAKISHIQLNLDVIRIDKLQIMKELHSEENILFVHGASGQGKSTLAYRYIQNFYPESWCFEIKLTENRSDALETALAISEYAKTLNTFILIYMDISPHDTGWEELIQSLSNFSNIKILITLREEDWKKSHINGVEFSFNEIELKFNEHEAKNIFQVLFEKQSIKQYLSFSEAWNNFGEKGSLLEFVYLVTQGGKLKERLQSQVNRLIDENNSSLISILRVIAVSTASGSRVNVRKTIDYFNIVPDLLFKRLESEYFLRIDKSKQWIEAYHPLRSIILEEILIDNGYAPWIEQFHIAFKLIHEEDIDIFLFHSLINHFHLREEIFPTILISSLNSLISIEKIIKVLVWLSVKIYVEDNLEYIKNIFNTAEGNFVLFLGADIANISNETIKDLFNSPIFSEDKRLKCMEIYNHLGMDNFKPEFLVKYLEKKINNISIPNTDKEWYCLSKILLWIWKYGNIEKLSYIDINTLVENEIQSPKIACHYATSLYLTFPNLFSKWKNLNRPRLLKQLSKKENLIGFEETEENIKAYFLSFDLSTPNTIKDSEDEENVVHAKTMIVIDILHKLFPDKKVISSQGYGHLFPKIVSHDDTIKNIPNKNLFIEEFIEINALFRRTINNQFRPKNWNIYTDNVLKMRKELLKYLNLTIRLVEQFFQSKTPIDPLRSKSTIVEEWNKVDLILKKKILLPSSAIDKLGFLDEDSTFKKGFNEINNINLSIKRYVQIQKSIRDYQTKLGNFYSQATSVFDINCATGKFDIEVREKMYQLLETQNISTNDLHLSWINLIDSIKELFLLQNEFDNIFSEVVDFKLNNDLKAQEIGATTKLAQLWYFYIHNPNIKTKYPQKEIQKRFDDREKSLHKEILSLLNKNEMESKFKFVEIHTKKKTKILQIKVENKLAIYSWYSCSEAIKKITAYIHKLTSFAKAVLEWNWKEIIFIPTINNYTINNFMIPMPTNHFLLSTNTEELNPIHHIPRELTNKECSLLNLSKFTSSTTDSINEIFDLTSKLFLYVSNLKDLKDLPENIDYEEEILLDYIKKINNHIDTVINPLIKKISLLSNEIDENIEEENDIYYEFASNLNSFWTHLNYDSILDNKKELNMHDLDIWCKELEQGIENLMLLNPLAIDLCVHNVIKENKFII